MKERIQTRTKMRKRDSKEERGIRINDNAKKIIQQKDDLISKVKPRQHVCFQ